MTDRITHRLARLEAQARRQYDGSDGEPPALSLDDPEVLARLTAISRRARRHPADVRAAGRALWRGLLDGTVDGERATPLDVRDCAIAHALDTARRRQRAAGLRADASYNGGHNGGDDER